LPSQVIAAMFHDERLTVVRERPVVEEVTLALPKVHRRLDQQLIAHPLKATAHFHALRDVRTSSTEVRPVKKRLSSRPSSLVMGISAANSCPDCLTLQEGLCAGAKEACSVEDPLSQRR